MRFGAALFLVSLLLVGCPAMTPQGAAPGANEGSSEASSLGEVSTEKDATASKVTEEVAAAVPKPQPGGISALPGDPGDQTALVGGAEIEPICRLTTGRIRYRVHGTIKRSGPNDEGQIVTSCPSENAVNFQFWNGDACETRFIDIRDCKFDTAVNSPDMQKYRFYTTEYSPSKAIENWHTAEGGDEAETNTPTAVLGAKACLFGDSLVDITTVVKPVSDGLPTCSVGLPSGSWLNGPF